MNIEQFKTELEKLNLKLTPEQYETLEKYYKYLTEYNKTTNLTRIINKEDVYLKHFYDSLTLVKITDFKKAETLCDIGTGAGFPGIVLKIVFPHLKVTLVDSNGKKTLFLKKLIDHLELKETKVIHNRAENLTGQYDLITTRAVAKLNVLLELCVPLLKVGGYFLAMKANAEEEFLNSKQAILKLNCELSKVINFLLPIESSKRTLIKIKKTKKTPNIYPRKYEQILKKPL